MAYNFLNLTNSIDLLANSIALRKPDGSIVDITNLFATQDQLNNTTISGFITNTALMSTLSNYATLSYINNFTTSQTLYGTTTISGTLVMPNITITPTTATKTIINSTASNGSIDFNINGIKYLGINDTTDTLSITSNFLTALGTTTLSGLITTGSISTPAITLNGTSLASTLALKAPLTNPTFTGLSTDTITATGAATISGITTHKSNVVLTGTNAWLGIGTSNPQKQIEVNNPSGANVSIKSYCGNGDNTLDMQSGSNGRFLIKVGSSGVVNLYANNANSTNYGLNLNLSTSINGLSFDTSGNAAFYRNIYTSSLVSAGAALFQNNLVVMGGTTSYFIGGPAGAYKTIFDTTGRFGIGMDFTTGITTPATQLHVVGDSTNTTGTCQFSSRLTGCTQISYIHNGTNADWYIRSGSISGNVYIQDQGGNIQLGNSSSTTTAAGSITCGALSSTTASTVAGTATCIEAVNPNSTYSNSKVSMNFYTDGTNGSNAQLTLTGTNTSGSSKTANIIMQQPTGLIIQGGSGTPIQLWVNNSVVAQTIATDGSITMPYKLTLASPPALSYTSVPTIGSSQIGFVSQQAGGTTGITTTLSSNLCSITLAMGVYLFSYYASIGTSTGGSTTVGLYENGTAINNAGFYIAPSSTTQNSGSQTFIKTNTANNTVYSIKALIATGSVQMSNSLLQAVRIA